MKKQFYIVFGAILLTLGACETLNTGISSGGGSAAAGHRGGLGSAFSGGSGGGGGGLGAIIGQGNGSGSAVARAASAMSGHKNCSSFPPPRIKCAQQASSILKQAGVPIKADNSVNGLVAKLRRIGWRDGPCRPGAVRHTAGSSAKGRHVGIVASNGQTIHNSGTKSKSCGILGPWNYPSWIARSRCLVPG